MNYAGKFDAKLAADGSGVHSDAHPHLESVTAHATHAPAGAIIVPDSQLLFNGEIKRSGVDQELTHDQQELVHQDYFKGEKRAALSSPDGAHLTGDLVNALTGHTEYAQADGSAAAGHVIGHVTKLVGTATAMRNGVSIILNQGDNVEKGDVVQSGSDSTLGVTFIDGTVFGLSSNAKMVLNEMVYDPNGSSNSSLISLVAGTISFVAGETAKHGDMKIDTPVATMGIRGTAVLVEIDFSIPGPGSQPGAKFQVLVEPDGSTGSYILFDKNTLTPIAEVNKAGQQINISNGAVSITNSPLSPDLQKLISDVFTLKFSDANPQTLQHFTDSITPQALAPIMLANGTSATPIVLLVNTAADSSGAKGGGTTNGTPRVDGPPTAAILDATGHVANAFATTEFPNTTGDSTDPNVVSIKVNWVDPNAGDVPTASAAFSGFTYNDAHGNPAALNALQVADVLAVEAKLGLVPDPGNNNNGSATFTYSVPDSAFDFLAAGETLTLTYQVTVNNNYAPNPEPTILTFTITVTGTNDQPIITTDAQTQLIQFAAGTSTPGGPLVSLNNEPTSGTFAFTDVDLTDTHTVSVALTTVSLIGPNGPIDPADLTLFESKNSGPMSDFEKALSVAIAQDSTGTGNGTISWQLADIPVFDADVIPAGETLKLYYTVTLTDSQGATDTKTIEVDITGTNAAATVWIHKVGDGKDGNWTTAADWGSGSVPTAADDVIIVTDQLHPALPAYPAIVTGDQSAHSVTMNDFVAAPNQNIPPELDVQAGASLTIGTFFDLSADSILKNAGTITVGSQLELLDDASNPVTPVNESVVTNSGTLNIAQGGDIQGLASVTNSGTIELKGGTLNVLVDIANTDGVTGGNINVDSGAKLVLGTDANNAGTHGGVAGRHRNGQPGRRARSHGRRHPGERYAGRYRTDQGRRQRQRAGRRDRHQRRRHRDSQRRRAHPRSVDHGRQWRRHHHRQRCRQADTEPRQRDRRHRHQRCGRGARSDRQRRAAERHARQYRPDQCQRYRQPAARRDRHRQPRARGSGRGRATDRPQHDRQQRRHHHRRRHRHADAERRHRHRRHRHRQRHARSHRHCGDPERHADQQQCIHGGGHRQCSGQRAGRQQLDAGSPGQWCADG